ncbi:hypothetical protein BHM03_00030830 [Ensete ventricosum]|nr:hypothetical protein BHM03_00030830 [Ensete ventricosum]
MRLNHVELFYALVAAIGNESRHCLRGRGGHMHGVCMQRWLATVRPPTGVAGHGLAIYKGRPATARPSVRGGHPRARSTAASPQGVTTRGQPYRQQGRRCRPQGWLPVGRVAVGRKG